MEGKVVTRELAAQCRQLAGPLTEDPQINMIKGQLLILMLRDLGGTKTYTIEAIDEETSESNLLMQVVRYHGKDALKLRLVNKV